MQARLTAVRAQVQAALDRAIGDLPPGELRDAMGYACNGGKRIRAEYDDFLALLDVWTG